MPRSRINCASCHKEIAGTKKGNVLVKINADFYDRENHKWVIHTIYLHNECYTVDNEKARQEQQNKEFKEFTENTKKFQVISKC